MSILYTRKLQNECEYFIGEKKIVKASIFVDFCEHLKLSEDFRREQLKILVIKKRLKRLFSGSKKARKKKPLVEATISYGKIILSRISNIMGFFYF